MSVRSRRSRRRGTATAIALTASLTAGAALLLCACGPDDPAADSAAGAAKAGATTAARGNGPAPAGSATSAASASGGPGTGKGISGSKGSASARPLTATAAPRNGTAHTGLTISDGSRYVVMNGTRVDFGTAVRDLAWSPDGKKAAFIDGDGDLVVTRPDGGGRVVVAENPGGQNWSHPTWQVRPSDSQYEMRALSNLLFAVRTTAGVSRLYTVPSTSAHGTPKVLGLGKEPGEDVPALPQTGNVWPNAADGHGDAVYANTDDGRVYIRDDYLRQQGSALTKGSQPAVNPAAGNEGNGGDSGNGGAGDIVFVRSVGGHDHLFVETSTDHGPVYQDLTPKATTDYTEPAWSPDGSVIAARTPDGIVTVPVADSRHTPVKVSDYLGLPAYRAS
ncbi:hypothetical protein [Streptomyces sp. NBC_01190]|uniref:hypothetical protein n=1 Tax=Streptomyces sp. NBC_01190 TaxID=2903767 RepID=UPI00386C5FD4|nr:hypothetical protein OG519_15845 [Streptomyces sp. NBC_01190]